MANLPALLNSTWSGWLFLFLTLFVIVVTKIIGRQHQANRERTKFSPAVWFSDWVNWATVLLNIVTAVILLGIRTTFAPLMGMSIEDPAQFEQFFAVMVGISGQLFWNRLLTMTAVVVTPSGGSGSGT